MRFSLRLYWLVTVTHIILEEHEACWRLAGDMLHHTLEIVWRFALERFWRLAGDWLEIGFEEYLKNSENQDANSGDCLEICFERILEICFERILEIGWRFAF